MKKLILITTVIALTVTSCIPISVIRPGQVGVKQSLGKLKGQPKSSGLVLYNPLVTQVVKLPTRTVNREVKLNLPSKEGIFQIGAPVASRCFRFHSYICTYQKNEGTSQAGSMFRRTAPFDVLPYNGAVLSCKIQQYLY